MYEYKYVELKTEGFFVGRVMEDHREIIREYAEKGYRYAGYIPTEMNNYGVIKYLDLIFEKEVAE